MTLDRLHVAALLDGRPGHEKQTLGLVEALGRRLDVRLSTIPVERPSPLRRLVESCRCRLPGLGLSRPELADAELLIGTGSSTHLPLLLYKKRYRIPAVTCMSPGWHLRGGFDLCFVPVHDGLPAGGNIVLTLGAPNCLLDLGEHQEGKGLVLIGGVDPASHSWQGTEVLRMVETIVTSDRRSWVIAASPRTPAETVSLLAALARAHANTAFFAYSDTGPGWIEERYRESSVAWVTADSISMMYEALAAGCRLGILPLPWRRSKNKFQRNQEVLLSRGLARSFLSWERDQVDWQTGQYRNEASHCAECILELLAR